MLTPRERKILKKLKDSQNRPLWLAGFAVKVPLFPFHTWLPLAHVQAPTAGSVLLAGVLLKIGTYGFVRFSLPMLPDASAACMPYVLWLSVAGIIYGALVALAQSDIKRLIAYSSVSHMGYVVLGLSALTATRVFTFSIVTNWFGYLVLAGTVLIVKPLICVS